LFLFFFFFVFCTSYLLDAMYFDTYYCKGDDSYRRFTCCPSLFIYR
jgi:hypothetical protein